MNIRLLNVVLDMKYVEGEAANICRMNLCNKSNKEALVCSNCKAGKNNLHTGHGVADRRCPIFLNRSHKMNKTSENKYKYYCTDNPATWEINNSCEQEEHNTKIYDTKRDNQGFEEVRGRYSRGRRGVGEDTQRVPDKGWKGIKMNTRAMTMTVATSPTLSTTMLAMPMCG